MTQSLREIIITAYQKLPETLRYQPATSIEIEAFELKYHAIPEEYRWFLTDCGGGAVGHEWLDGITQLKEDHEKFIKESIMPNGWRMRNVFIIGFDGSGNPIGICLNSGKVMVEDHTYGGIHEVAVSLEAYLLKLLKVK